jgi:hypothetical protein
VESAGLNRFSKLPFAHSVVQVTVHPAMGTLLESTKSRISGQPPRPSHPVDAALWGLAERLADADSGVTGVAEGARSERPVSAERPSQQIRVVRLPARAGNLPSVGRLSQREPVVGPRSSTPPKRKPGSLDAALPSQPVHPGAVDVAPEATPPSVGRAQFTILKDRRPDHGSERRDRRDRRIDPSQDSPASGESRSGRPKRRAITAKKRAGLSLSGWLFLTAGAVVAAAIALLAPSWL